MSLIAAALTLPAPVAAVAGPVDVAPPASAPASAPAPVTGPYGAGLVVDGSAKYRGRYAGKLAGYLAYERQQEARAQQLAILRAEPATDGHDGLPGWSLALSALAGLLVGTGLAGIAGRLRHAWPGRVRAA